MQGKQAARIEPLLPPDWDAEAREALGAFPKGLQFVLSQWENEEGDPRGRNVLGCLARYPALARAFLTFNNHVAIDSTLSAREREILILRTAWLRRSEYEYIQHVILGLRAGLTEEEVARIEEGPDAPGWQAADADLVRAADELCDSGGIGAATWARLSGRYGDEQMMDIVFLVGCYQVVAMMMQSLDIPLEPGVEPIDDDTRARMFAPTDKVDE
jgi:alkylhydroperoxidase family enzyme